jgi:hypothetical protein
MTIVLIRVAACLAATTIIAHAADVPNLVGTWKSTGEFAVARTGKARAGFPETPVFNHPQRPALVVEQQNGRGLTGYVLLPDGAKDPFVGVLKRDGKQVIVSTDNPGTGTIDVYGDEVEWCWQDVIPDVRVATCDIMKKAP